MEYIGCYKDTADRDLRDVLIRDYDGNTPQKCTNVCKTKGKFPLVRIVSSG